VVSPPPECLVESRHHTEHDDDDDDDDDEEDGTAALLLWQVQTGGGERSAWGCPAPLHTGLLASALAFVCFCTLSTSVDVELLPCCADVERGR